MPCVSISSHIPLIQPSLLNIFKLLLVSWTVSNFPRVLYSCLVSHVWPSFTTFVVCLMLGDSFLHLVCLYCQLVYHSDCHSITLSWSQHSCLPDSYTWEGETTPGQLSSLQSSQLSIFLDILKIKLLCGLLDQTFWSLPYLGGALQPVNLLFPLSCNPTLLFKMSSLALCAQCKLCLPGRRFCSFAGIYLHNLESWGIPSIFWSHSSAWNLANLFAVRLEFSFLFVLQMVFPILLS